ncbi:glycosyltransferase family 1 protein [Patescibacteria group bacterium]|nr:MAG: glycosyltransferase family 1 protein [Patescibacteria group bacterium]
MLVFDARSLADAKPSGVHGVTRAWARGLAAALPPGAFVAVANAAGAGAVRARAALGPDVPLVVRRFPNKLLHAAMRFLGVPTIEALARAPRGSTVIANPHFLRVRPDATFVLIVHDLSYFREPHFFSRRMRLWHRVVDFPRLIARADRIAVCSAHTKRDLMELFAVPAAKIGIIRPSIDPALFSPPAAAARDAARAARGIPRDYAFVFSDGPRKNLAAALSGIAAAKTDLAVVVAGSEHPKAVAAAARAAGIAERVLALGYCDDRERAALLSGARLLLYPSLYEGFGLPPLEAMALGVPVIAAHGSALGETAGDAAVLVDPQDAASVTCAVERVLSEPAATAARVARGRERAAALRPEKAVKDLLMLIKDARHAPLRAKRAAAVVHYRHAHRD